jgi:hypothetical protein
VLGLLLYPWTPRPWYEGLQLWHLILGFFCPLLVIVCLGALTYLVYRGAARK